MLLCVLSLFFNTDSNQLLQRLLLLILVSLSTEYILINVFKTRSIFNIKNISSAFFIFLITDPQTNIFLLIFSIIFCHLSYQLINYDRESIFNSPVLSIFIFSLIGLKVSWWGINSSFLIIFIMILLGIANNYFYKSLRIISLYFLLIFTFSFIFSINPLYSIKQLMVPGLLFFGFYLLTKNMSLILHDNRLSSWYVISASLLAITIPKFGFFTDTLITSVVITDLGFFVIKLLRPQKISKI